MKRLKSGAWQKKTRPPQVVRQVPTQVGRQQPTVAVITSDYCQKVAVDAMLDSPETYVRYTTVGEGITTSKLFEMVKKALTSFMKFLFIRKLF